VFNIYIKFRACYNLFGGFVKRFNMIDEEFVCEHCKKNVPKLNYSARDHCLFCLYSKHVDVNPGDRMNNCGGLLEPIDIEKYKNTYKIIYKCKKCNDVVKNIVANDDNFDLICLISSKK